MGREEGEQWRSKRHCFFFFFLRKRNVIWKKKKKFGSDPKMGYDNVIHRKFFLVKSLQ